MSWVDAFLDRFDELGLVPRPRDEHRPMGGSSTRQWRWAQRLRDPILGRLKRRLAIG